MTTRKPVSGTAQLTARLVSVERRGHPWVYSSAISMPSGVGFGDTLDVLSIDGDFIGRGIADPKGAIALRIWTRDPEHIDDRLLIRRVADAWNRRKKILRGQDTDAFRLIHGEADQMPGVICDVYGDCAVVQSDGRAAETLLPAVAAAIVERVPPVQNVVYKPRRSGGAAGKVTVLAGHMPDELIVAREHGMRFEVDVVHGQKTGAYLDQRENRRLVRESADGLNVLNLFSYTGGFSVAAALGGASSVVSVDQAAPANESAKRNFALNGFDARDPRFNFWTEDALIFMKRAAKADERFDLVILDPPSLAHSMKQIPAARKAYARLNRAAIELVAPGGILLSASCTRRITSRDLRRVVSTAAESAGRKMTVLKRTGAAPDHPVLKAFPEGDYLALIWAKFEA